MGRGIKGSASFLRKMNKMKNAVRPATRQALAESAEEINDKQRAFAPRRTGALAASITYTFGDRDLPAYASVKAGNAAHGDPSMIVILSAGNSRVRYAHLVEFGTAPHDVGGKFERVEHPGARQHPFFYPAFHALKRKARARLARSVGAAIRKTAKSG